MIHAQLVSNSATAARYFHLLSFMNWLCFLTLTTRVYMKLMIQHSEHLLMNHHALLPLPALGHKLISFCHPLPLSHSQVRDM